MVAAKPGRTPVHKLRLVFRTEIEYALTRGASMGPSAGMIDEDN